MWIIIISVLFCIAMQKWQDIFFCKRTGAGELRQKYQRIIHLLFAKYQTTNTLNMRNSCKTRRYRRFSIREKSRDIRNQVPCTARKCQIPSSDYNWYVMSKANNYFWLNNLHANNILTSLPTNVLLTYLLTRNYQTNLSTNKGISICFE